jgi:hypothetical protein
MALTTKPRWDKYDPYVANFRGPLAADVNLATQANAVLAVGVNSSGAITVGAGQTGIKGVTIIPVGVDMHGVLLDGGVNIEAGDITDVGKHGEITNFKPWQPTGTAPASAAGTNYYGHPDGAVLPSTGPGAVYVGHTVEADRLIVEVSDNGPASALQNAVPVGLAGVGATAQVVLTWTPVRNATGYKVQKSTDNSTFTAAGTPTATTQTVTGLTAGSANHFRVLATVGGVDSAYSTSVQVTVL